MSTLSFMQVTGTLLAALALGGMMFFTLVFAPLAFRRLSPAVAGEFIRGVFPVYYATMFGMVAIAALCLWSRPEALVLGAIAVLFLFTRVALLPRMNQAREASSEGDSEEREVFARLHGISAIINLAQIAALLAAVIRLLVA